MTFANTPPSRMAPSSEGSAVFAVRGIISRGLSVCSFALAITAIATSSVSSSTVPKIHPITDFFASLSDLAENNVQHVAPAYELVTCNDRVRYDDSDGGEHSSGRVVSQLQQIRNSKLREVARAPGNHTNDQQPQPPAEWLPKGYETIAISV